MNKTAKIQKIYPLTPMQEGMLFHSLIDNESKAYYYQLFFSINKTLDIMLFEKSFNFLIKRYDILRTSFVYQKIQQPRQVVLKERHANIYFEDISQLKDDEKVLFIEEFKRKDMEKGFDLTKDILIRISIIQTGKETYKIIWSHHHILMDAWCIAIIIEEFFTIYQSLKENKPLKLEAVYPYSSYIKWLVKQDKEEAALYWKEYLKDYQQQAVLPKQGGMAVKKGYKREKISFVIDEELTKGLEAVAKENHVTLGTTFQTIWGILLQKYNNTDDVVFGSVVSGRPHKVAGIEKMVGLFINTIPVRIKCNTIKSFSFLLKQVQESLLSSKKYDFLPLYEIQSNSLLKHDVFSQIMSFTYYNFEREFQNLKGKQDLEFTIDDVEVFDQTHYDLNIIAVPDSELAVIFIYNALVYDRNFLKKIEGNFKEIAKSVVKDHDVLIKHIEILTKEEKNQIIYEFNNTEADYQKEKTIQEMFEEQVEKTPDNVAVVCEDKKLTYRELNVKANQIARILRKKGIGPDSIEGIMTERSLEMITGIMGILKAGGAYLPIDPEYPAERIKYMLEDSGTFVLLTTKSTARDFPFYLLQSAGRNAVEPIATCIRPQIKDLDSIPIPDRSLVDYEKYNRYIGQAMVKHAMSIQATRGCPYQCAYCHKIWPKNHVVRTAENIFRELKMYYDIGIRRFAFIDDIFNLNVENSSRLFKLIIQNGLKVHIFFPNGVRGDILIKEYMDLMVRAGVVNVAFALETASPRLQKLIKKNINLEKLKENIEYLTAKYPHVITELFSMHGFPTETEEEANMTLDFIKSIKWLHFPYVHILKIYPDTDMAKLAVGNGVSKEAIERSADLAYHELPDTLPFSKGFTRKYQAEFLNEYFLSKERLLKVLPLQMKIMTEAELVQKYNSYLPAEIKCFDDLLSLAGISRVELAAKESVKEDDIAIQNLNEKIRRNFPAQKYKEGSLRIFLLDLSQFFSDDKRNMLYGLVEPPLGLMYLMTYLNKEFGEKVFGKIAKSYVDFDSYEELKVLIEDFKPHVIGIRTLTYYRNFFHETVSAMRQWGVNVPIIAGGPYATSSYAALLKDRNIDLVVLGEGEITLSEVMGKIIENGGKLPDDGVLRKIPGIAYVENKEKLPQEAFNREVILLDELPAGIDKGSENLDNINTPYNLAYVIYTSGTTGKPKGTMIEHRNVVRLLFNDKIQFNFNAYDIWTMFHSICFDFSVWEMYGALLYGGKLVIVPRIIAQEPKEYLKLLKKEKVTILNQTPTAFYNLINEEMGDKGKDLDIRYIIFGGEALKPMMLKGWSKKYPGTKLINMYGITETTVHATYKEITEREIEEGVSNIGRPIPTITAYIMDSNMKLIPLGVAGELCVGGDGVGRGYLNRSELTAERFVQNPYKPEERLYRSGDMVKMSPDGEMEYLGRIDQQVKIRGHRIELGEIESALLKHDLIKEAVAIAREDTDGNKSLYAYIISDENLGISELREYLSKELPEYMIPSYFLLLDKMPLTSNGKLDRRALPGQGGSINSGVEYAAPGNKLEEKLVGIWQEVLGIERVGINDSFFELGGDSLKATTLISKMHKVLNIEVPLREVFNRQTIKEFGEYIKGAEENIYSSIKCIEEKEWYQVSSAQKRLFILKQLEGEGTSYNMPAVMMIEGKVDKERFEGAFRTLIKRHETLRTSFEFIDGEPVQRVHKDIDFKITYMESGEGGIKKIIKEFIRSFELCKAPLIRISLVSLSEDRYILLYDMHHIISDGISMGILIREFVDLYDGKRLPELKIQYKDYSAWQNELFRTNVIKKQEEYWINIFNGEIPVLNMPTDYPRASIQSFEGNSISFKAGKELAEGLNVLAAGTGTTLYMVLLAAFNVLLSKYTGQEDILVGSPIAGRPHADLVNIIGMFVNTLAMRNCPKHYKTFKEFLGEVKENSLKAYENQDYQFEELVDKLNIKRDLSRNPLFDTMFVLQNMDIRNIEITGLKIMPYEFESRVSKFDLTLYAVEEEENILFNMEYCTKLFRKETIEKMTGHFLNIIKQIVEKPMIKLSEMELVSEEEKRRILFEFNDTKAEYPKYKTIYELFEEQVERTPGKTAIAYENKGLTYRELNEKSNRLARVLREKMVKPDGIVGIMAERSLEMIIGILGILKAGGAYLPIDPGYPHERIKYMLEDSGARILLTQHRFMEKTKFKGEVINLEKEKLYDGNGANLEKVNTLKDLAYVIYTSGTTGKPKGTMIEHYSVINRINWMQKKYPLDESDIILQKTPYTFDVSVWELFWWAFAGAKLYILAAGGEKDPAAIIEAVKNNKVTTIHFVPSMLNVFLGYIKGQKNTEDLSGLRYVFCSGEVLKKQHVETFNRELRKRYNTKLHNLYGPTEATVDVTFFDCPEEEEIENIPIGKPIDNIRLYILDRNSKIQPIGVAGELCISGDGLARGYLNKPELTAEKFVPNPFIAGERIYRTGDLARWLPDGNIEFLGRIDAQVKIRGFRVELGEIESLILKHEAIREAFVIDREDEGGNKSLCAYMISDRELKAAEIREFLSKELPEYMIPSKFVQLEKIPLTPNGKVDRRALPDPSSNTNEEEEYTAPANEVEEKLACIWQEVLGLERVGVNDGFFKSGGDSIKAIQVITHLREYMLTVEIKDLFQHSTIRELSSYVKPINRRFFQGMVEGEVGLTPIQKWFFEQGFFDMNHFNQSVMLYGKDGFDEKIIRKVFDKIVGHHDALRMTYRTEGEKIVQYNRGMEGELYSLKVVDLTGDVNYVEKIEEESNRLQRSIDLKEGPLVKLGLFKTTEGDHLLIVIHHLVVDGVSWRIIFEDLSAGYVQAVINKEIKLPDKTDSFKDWSEILQTYANGKELSREIEYWKELEKTYIIPLPKDNVPKENKLKDSNILKMELSENDTEKLLKNINRAYNTEINDILLTALGLAVNEWTGEERILVNLEGHGREKTIEGIDITRTVGWFTSAYPVILGTVKSDNLSYQIKAVKENLRHIPNKGIGYGLIKYLVPEGNKGTMEFNLKPEISFNYLGQFDKDVETGIFGISPLRMGQTGSPDSERKYVFDINGMIVGGRLLLTFNYNKFEYKESSVLKLIEGYKRNLMNIFDHCIEKKEVELTSTDLGNSALSIEELENIMEIINN